MEKLEYKDMLELAACLAEANSGYITGSLMMKERGIDLGREPGDVDIIVDRSIIRKRGGLNIPVLSQKMTLGNDTYRTVGRFMYMGIKIEFLAADISGNEEEQENCSYSPTLARLVPLASVKRALEEKKRYVRNDKTPESVKKHSADIEVLECYLKEQEKVEKERQEKYASFQEQDNELFDSIRQAESEIDAAQEAREKYRRDREDLRRRFIASECPFKDGDIVERTGSGMIYRVDGFITSCKNKNIGVRLGQLNAVGEPDKFVIDSRDCRFLRLVASPVAKGKGRSLLNLDISDDEDWMNDCDGECAL